jgi:small-conductance mechanosensitive channel
VRTYKGANVLVPNSTLVSSTVVNWTQEGADRRRVDIPVGVGYGTDPETVVELLEGVATKHPQVAKIPAPKALFMEFAESSLGFQLNAWFSEKDWYTGSSDLRVQVNDALVAAGIQVAFPQRDLHLRSVPGGVSLVPGEASPASDGD